MSYKSPIEIATDLSNAFMLEIENEVVKAVYHVGVKVDKDELLKALVYDREQYKAGYLDGIENRIPIEYIKKELKKLDSNINYAGYVGNEMLDQLIYAKSWVEEVLLKGWEKENGKIPQRDKTD